MSLKTPYSFRIEARTAETVTAIILTGVAIILHWVFMQNAGGLWRDEVGTWNFASMPSLGTMISSLDLDAFPILSRVTMRTWSGLGLGSSDAAIRLYGFMVGCGILAALWLNARFIGRSVPLTGLALLGLNPMFIFTCDSIRPYGLGTLLALLAFGSFWLVVFAPDWKRIVTATLLGMIAVHCLYPNVIFLLAIVGGGVTVCILKRSWTRAALIGLMGLICVATMIPYLGVLGRVAEWAELVKRPFGLWHRMLGAAIEAFGSPEFGMIGIWFGASCLSIGVVSQVGGRTLGYGSARKSSAGDIIIYALVVLIISALGQLVFFRIAQIWASPWYYVPLMGMMALCLDVILGQWKRGAVIRIALAMIAVILFGSSAWKGVHVRQTNVDLVASKLEETAQTEDLIVVSPWVNGVSFQRYYHGKTPWVTVPPLEDLTVHRFDLVKQKMIEKDVMTPVISRITNTLDSGHTIWVVGGLPEVTPDLISKLTSPAHGSDMGCSDALYCEYWGGQVALDLKAKGVTRRVLRPVTPQAVRPHEDVSVESYCCPKARTSP